VYLLTSVVADGCSWKVPLGSVSNPDDNTVVSTYATYVLLKNATVGEFNATVICDSTSNLLPPP
jgi:hypothetical protein